jgi:hypothetical protein
VIHPIGECQWEDLNWNGEGHRTCINTELGTFCRLLYPQHGYCGRSMTGCMLVDPLGAKVVRLLGLLSGWHGAYVLGKFNR